MTKKSLIETSLIAKLKEAIVKIQDILERKETIPIIIAIYGESVSLETKASVAKAIAVNATSDNKDLKVLSGSVVANVIIAFKEKT